MNEVNEVIQLQEENVALVKQIYAGFEERDVSILLNVLAENVDWFFLGPQEIPFAGHYRGHQQVEAFFAKALATSEFLVFEPREFVPGFSTVLVQGFERVRARSTGRTWETEWAHVFSISEGKIIKLREYYDTSVIVEAFREH